MRKYTYLENSIKLSEIESRISKNTYFSKGGLPGGSDARFFKFLEENKKIPNKKLQPNLYHWYVMMKQFSSRTVDLWMKRNQAEILEDTLLMEFLKRNNGLPSAQCQRENILILVNGCGDDENHPKIQDEDKGGIRQKKLEKPIQSDQLHNAISPSKDVNLKLNIDSLTTSNMKPEVNAPVDQQYVMDISLKKSHEKTLEDFKQRLKSQKMDLISIKMIKIDDRQPLLPIASLQKSEQNILSPRNTHPQKIDTNTDSSSSFNELRLTFRINLAECQNLKDKISLWPQVENIRVKKEKKVNISVPATVFH